MKGILRSKTFWVAAPIVVVGILQQLSTIPELGQYQDLLVSVAGLVMIIMRLISDNKPVTIRHPMQKAPK